MNEDRFPHDFSIMSKRDYQAALPKFTLVYEIPDSYHVVVRPTSTLHTLSPLINAFRGRTVRYLQLSPADYQQYLALRRVDTELSPNVDSSIWPSIEVGPSSSLGPGVIEIYYTEIMLLTEEVK